MTINVYSCR